MLFTSLEFYVIAFALAIAVVCFFLSGGSHGDKSSIIRPLSLEEDASGDATAQVFFASGGKGEITIRRQGLVVGQGSAAYLVVNAQGSKLSIKERMGAQGNAAMPVAYTGTAILPKIAGSGDLSIKYESDITSQWGQARLPRAGGSNAAIVLKY